MAVVNLRDKFLLCCGLRQRAARSSISWIDDSGIHRGRVGEIQWGLGWFQFNQTLTFSVHSYVGLCCREG